MHDIDLILLISFGFCFALLFGVITNRLGLSPIVGYLLAGIVIGPHTPGFVADPKIAHQLAEIGVILLMFGVGLHFHLSDLIRVRSVAVPGAVAQITAATLMTAFIAWVFELPLMTGVILGLAVSVASTVVLLRELMANNLLHTSHGHIAVGWLIVEDIFTVLALVMLPALKTAITSDSGTGMFGAFILTLVKLGALVVVVLVGGKRVIPRFMNYIARSRSRELFILAVLVIALGVATGAALIFGVSMALGAFLAGMVVNQSDVSHQAASDALPLRDAFAVLFFISVGILFDPAATLENWSLIACLMAVILIGKPLAAFILIVAFGYPLRTGLIVAIALAQIGEFSFILAEMARSLDFLEARDSTLLVSCAIISIAVNPLLFKLIKPIEKKVMETPRLRGLLSLTSDIDSLSVLPTHSEKTGPQAIVVGYGPVGQTVTQILKDFQINPAIIDMNVDTVRRLRDEGVPAIYGDADSQEILISAGIEQAEFLLITQADPQVRSNVISTALALNPKVNIVVRARYMGEGEALEDSGASAIAYEEVEVAVAVAKLLLREVGVNDSELYEKTLAIRRKLVDEVKSRGYERSRDDS